MYKADTSNGEQAVLHPANDSEHTEPECAKRSTFIPHMLLSCVVFWLCGFLFGLTAFVLARKNSSRYIINLLLSKDHCS